MPGTAVNHTFKGAAAAAAIVFSCASAFADDDILVTATRFAESDPRVAANISVITAEDIRNTPATNVPDLLKAAAGIEVRPLYGPMGIDATVDMRGFGDTASSNTLVLLDGQRLNPIDSAGISWSTIPLASVERIEIIRGSGAVLYGDQASGGVINIVTDKSHRPEASVEATAGSYGYRGADAHVAGSLGDTYGNLVAHYADSDGWRQNSQADQQSASGRIGHRLAGGDVYADIAGYKDADGLPGALLANAFPADPTATRTPYDKQQRDGYRLRPGVALEVSSAVRLEGEIALEHENYRADDVSFASIYERQRDTVSATPRVRWIQSVAGMRNETVAGLDYYGGKVASNDASTSDVIADSAHQYSESAYLQDIVDFTPHWSLTLGARDQHMVQEAQQGAYVANYGFGPTPVPGLDGSSSRSRSAFDLGVAGRGEIWRAFAKIGSVYRFPNTDELFGFNSITGNPVFAGNLLPQHGTSGEIGTSVSLGPAQARVSVFRMDLHDEIAYDGNSFANVNLPQTRRQGVEAEWDAPLGSLVRAHAAYTYTDARFSAGSYAGNTLPLVAHDKASVRLSSKDGGYGAYALAATYVGDQRYSGDFANLYGSLPGYTTVDLQGIWRFFSSWTITAKLINATNARYAPYGGYSSFDASHYYYPADARSLFVSLRYALR